MHNSLTSHFPLQTLHSHHNRSQSSGNISAERGLGMRLFMFEYQMYPEACFHSLIRTNQYPFLFACIMLSYGKADRVHKQAFLLRHRNR